jgi:hypothetical protein
MSLDFHYFERNVAGHKWLTPVILATQEEEIRRTATQSQLGQIVYRILSRKHPSQKMGWWSGSRCRPCISSPSTTKKTTTKTNKRNINRR